MGAHSFRDLLSHVGHDVSVVTYGKDGVPPVNVAIECNSCGCVLVDYERPPEADFEVYSPKRDDIPHVYFRYWKNGQELIEQVEDEVMQAISGFVEGVAPGGKASTIVDLSGDQPVVIRAGAISLERLRAVVPSIEALTD